MARAGRARAVWLASTKMPAPLSREGTMSFARSRKWRNVFAFSQAKDIFRAHDYMSCNWRRLGFIRFPCLSLEVRPCEKVRPVQVASISLRRNSPAMTRRSSSGKIHQKSEPLNPSQRRRVISSCQLEFSGRDIAGHFRPASTMRGLLDLRPMRKSSGSFLLCRDCRS